jgi:hypothetical protein
MTVDDAVVAAPRRILRSHQQPRIGGLDADELSCTFSCQRLKKCFGAGEPYSPTPGESKRDTHNLRRGNGLFCMTLHDAKGSGTRYFLSFPVFSPNAEKARISLVYSL